MQETQSIASIDRASSATRSGASPAASRWSPRSYEEQTHGMTANAFVSVSLDPPLVLVSLDNRSNMHRILPSVRPLRHQRAGGGSGALSNHFAGRTAPGLHVRFVHRERCAAARRRGGVLRGGGDRRASGRRPHAVHRPGGAFRSARRQAAAVLRRPIPADARGKGQAAQWPEDEFSLFSIGSVDPPIT